MIRMHMDDVRDSMAVDRKADGEAHFLYIRDWLARHGAIIVLPDDVQIPDNFMPGCFTMRRGRWSEDEPYPPYGGYRKLYEDAVASGPPENPADGKNKTL